MWSPVVLAAAAVLLTWLETLPATPDAPFAAPPAVEAAWPDAEWACCPDAGLRALARTGGGAGRVLGRLARGDDALARNLFEAALELRGDLGRVLLEDVGLLDHLAHGRGVALQGLARGGVLRLDRSGRALADLGDALLGRGDGRGDALLRARLLAGQRLRRLTLDLREGRVSARHALLDRRGGRRLDGVDRGQRAGQRRLDALCRLAALGLEGRADLRALALDAGHDLRALLVDLARRLARDLGGDLRVALLGGLVDAAASAGLALHGARGGADRALDLARGRVDRRRALLRRLRAGLRGVGGALVGRGLRLALGGAVPRVDLAGGGRPRRRDLALRAADRAGHLPVSASERALDDAHLLRPGGADLLRLLADRLADRRRRARGRGLHPAAFGLRGLRERGHHVLATFSEALPQALALLADTLTLGARLRRRGGLRRGIGLRGGRLGARGARAGGVGQRLRVLARGRLARGAREGDPARIDQLGPGRRRKLGHGRRRRSRGGCARTRRPGGCLGGRELGLRFGRLVGILPQQVAALGLVLLRGGLFRLGTVGLATLGRRTVSGRVATLGRRRRLGTRRIGTCRLAARRFGRTARPGGPIGVRSGGLWARGGLRLRGVGGRGCRSAITGRGDVSAFRGRGCRRLSARGRGGIRRRSGRRVRLRAWCRRAGA